MARKRMIDPHFWESAQDKGWKSDECAVMMAAISCSDDEGKGRISELEATVKGIVSTKKFKTSVKTLADSIIIFKKLYFLLPNFAEYQKISHPTPSRIPNPTDEEIKTYLQNLPEKFQKTSPTIEYNINKYNISKENISAHTVLTKENIWIRTFGRNPNLPEQEKTDELINQFGIEKVFSIYKEASLKGFRNLATLISALDEKGNIKPRETNNETNKRDNKPASFRRSGTEGGGGFTIIKASNAEG